MKKRTPILLLFLATLLWPNQIGFADQRRDWMVDIQPEGTYLDVDAVFPGAQLTLEHRIPIYEKFSYVFPLIRHIEGIKIEKNEQNVNKIVNKLKKLIERGF